jgi:hypothetical protein
MIAFLALIWVLYNAFIKSAAPPEEDDDEASPLPVSDTDTDTEPRTGSVLEEEYPLPSESDGGESEVTENEPSVDDDGLEESAAEVLEVIEPEGSVEEKALPPDPESPSSAEGPGEVKE